MTRLTVGILCALGGLIIGAAATFALPTNWLAPLQLSAFVQGFTGATREAEARAIHAYANNVVVTIMGAQVDEPDLDRAALPRDCSSGISVGIFSVSRIDGVRSCSIEVAPGGKIIVSVTSVGGQNYTMGPL